ncbi:MAG: hypothetical protein ABEI96_06515 [Haloarculaceae archaeon]
MGHEVSTGVLATIASLVAFTGSGAAQTVGVSTITGQPIYVRALGAFVLVLAVGSVLLVQYGSFLDRMTTSMAEGHYSTVVYGLLAQGAILFFGGYGLSQVVRIGGGSHATGILMVIVGVLLLILSGAGFAVVGARITEFRGERDLRYGVVLGAVLGGLALAIPSFVVATLVWMLLVAIGVGASTKKWFHGSHDADTASG